jgi:hypothetical protein
MLWTLGLTAFFLGSGYAALLGLRKNPVEFFDSQPHVTMVALFASPILATIIGVMVGLRGVYLAQIVAVFVGSVASAMTLLVRLQIKVLPSPEMYEWIAIPLVAAVAGFLSGLRVGGRLQFEKRMELRPVDDWDRSAKPRQVEVEPPASRRWWRLLFGIVAGVAVNLGLVNGIIQAVKLLFKGNVAIIERTEETVSSFTIYIALFVAGLVAGSRTRAGLAQGLLCGLASFGVWYFAFPVHEGDWPILLLTCIGMCTVGGVIGRFVFRPSRIFREDVRKMK